MTDADDCVLTKFPAADLPSPRTTENLREFPVWYEKGQPPVSIQLNRWFCCQCAEKGGDDDEVPGMVHDDRPDQDESFQTCCREDCGHTKCHNCGLGPDHRSTRIVRTVGGLHASPRFIDPVYWECPCGEWVGNVFDSRCVLGQTRCVNADGRAKGRAPCPRVLNRHSIVMNQYGQRLGTADQATMVAGGPWCLQRQALSDPGSALATKLRQKPFRTPRPHLSERRVWRHGDCAPQYPPRPAPPTKAPVDPDAYYEYEGGYLAGVPSEPSEKGKGKGKSAVHSRDEEGNSPAAVA